MRPVSEAKFLGLEIDESLSFKGHIQECTDRAQSRLNILRILARGGTDPINLLRLYKTYVCPIFEYGCIAFLHVPDMSLRPLQLIQNMALRIVLDLPSYISIDRLHEYASISRVKERLSELGSRHLAKMRVKNVLIRDIVEIKERDNLKHILESRGHRLDILLPAQRPVL